MSESANLLLEIENVNVSRLGNPILQDFSWKAEPGEHWAILGPNGAGKTTLARLISGADRADSGRIVVLGEEVEHHDSVFLATQVGYAGTDTASRIPSGTSVFSVVSSASWGQSADYGDEYEQLDQSRAEDLLSALGVGDLGSRMFDSLSEGERRRVLIARALMSNPEIIILDEPTAGLDLGGRETLMGALREIMSGPNAPAVIMITHEPEHITAEFSHALLIRGGQRIAAGPINQVITDTLLTQAFGLPLSVSRSDGRFQAKAAQD
ncbi:ATP-binding cassette domain-containing protein [Actinomycetaceae bacterium WB03_NA08]|uniref:ATP-binding cassette domain-containing protein n=1 Tax=Scrofimicrobium canadense TaxID=2652290 RepID=A0A6N7W2J6_9ACTO|nr:ATP-binding cassette domain-containing protein [Scrofimicrobium canadense]MSS83515.1 ATP-binding cassette domain-containing protein [Scrofimicrobium canadense]